MPSGMAAATREFVARLDKTGLVLERNRYSTTGFTNVIKVKNKFQARLQVKGDGKGGVRKRKQYSLPGLFDTAQEAAEMLALAKRDGLQFICDEDGIPRKQQEQRKPRKKPEQPPPRPVTVAQLLPMQMPAVAMATAMPIASPMMHVPLVTVSPLPMRPLGLMPTAWPLPM